MSGTGNSGIKATQRISFIYLVYMYSLTQSSTFFILFFNSQTVNNKVCVLSLCTDNEDESSDPPLYIIVSLHDHIYLRKRSESVRDQFSVTEKSFSYQIPCTCTNCVRSGLASNYLHISHSCFSQEQT